MVTRAKFLLSLFLIFSTSSIAFAIDGPVRLRPDFKPGQQNRYLITASVNASVEPGGKNGISSSLHREVTATILLRTVEVGEQGEVSQEAIIEEVSSSATINGVEARSNATGLAGKKIDFTFNSSGHLLKCSIPDPASDLGLAEIVFSLVKWFPAEERAVGESWKASGQGLAYADRLSEIAKNSTTQYRLLGVDKETASIEGAVTLSQSGASVISTGEGKLNVNVVAAGTGRARIDYDLSGSRVIAGTTETRLEGRLANIPPTAAGQKMQPREGTLTETARFSIKLIP